MKWNKPVQTILSQALSLFQLGKRQEGGACKFQWKEKVDNSQTTSNQKANPVSIWGMNVLFLQNCLLFVVLMKTQL